MYSRTDVLYCSKRCPLFFAFVPPERTAGSACSLTSRRAGLDESHTIGPFPGSCRLSASFPPAPRMLVLGGDITLAR